MSTKRGEGPTTEESQVSVDKAIHINIPLPMLLERWERFLETGLSPEIYLTAHTLDATALETFLDLKRALDREGLMTTIHGPYMDLSPGAVDERIREATLGRLTQTLHVASILEPEILVFHPGYDRWRHGGKEELWLEQSLKTWAPLVARAEEEGLVIAVENVFEEAPHTLKALVEGIGSESFRVCFDIGHFHLFSRLPLAEWYEALKDYLVELHLHDNHGREDDHLAIGEGKIDFDLLFETIKGHPNPLIYTLEPHSEKDLERGIGRLKALLSSTPR